MHEPLHLLWLGCCEWMGLGTGLGILLSSQHNQGLFLVLLAPVPGFFSCTVLVHGSLYPLQANGHQHSLDLCELSQYNLTPLCVRPWAQVMGLHVCAHIHTRTQSLSLTFFCTQGCVCGLCSVSLEGVPLLSSGAGYTAGVPEYPPSSCASFSLGPGLPAGPFHSFLLSAAIQA